MAKCPVCEKQTEKDNERLCPSCGWEFRYILGGLSPEEEAVYNRKLEISRRNWQEIRASRKQQKSPRADPPDTREEKEPESVSESVPESALYSEETPVPDLKRDPFEHYEEFEARISGHKPVPAGKATLIKEKYDIETGRFPAEVTWEKWVRNLEGTPDPESELHVVAERDLARPIYEAGPAYCLFVRLAAEREKVSVSAAELFAGNSVLPVTGGHRDLPAVFSPGFGTASGTGTTRNGMGSPS